MHPSHNKPGPGPMAIKIMPRGVKFPLLCYSLKSTKIALAIPQKTKLTTELANKNSISPNTSQLKMIMKNRILRQFKSIKKRYKTTSLTKKADRV